MLDHGDAGRPLGRVLVVEDERIVALDLVNTLEDLGYAVVGSVSTGEAAVARAGESAPDVVLMDVRLAGAMDGVHAADEIRKSHGIPIIFLTAHADNDTLRRAAQTEPFGYLVKPFKGAELHCAIEIAVRRHEIDTQLRARERWLASTLRSIGDGVVATDTAQRVTLMNPVAEALTGWCHDDALGRRLDDIMRLVTAPDDAPLASPIERALQDRAIVLLETDARLIARTGASIAVAHSAAPIISTNGTLAGGVMVFRDVSERRRAEDELRRSNAELELRVSERTAELEAANRELEMFTSSVAHDLRAPLRHIAGFSQVLIEDHEANLGTDVLRLLQRVRTATAHMAHLIDDLLRLSRIGKAVLERTRVDVSALAVAILTGLRASDGERSVTVAIADGLVVDADLSLFRTVIENLINNAWKFTARSADATIEIGALAIGDERGIFVRDNGVGFDPARAPTMFGAFQRFHSQPHFGGNGMGLAIAERIVRRHGGRIWADGRPGGGATFYIAMSAG
jgi:PAS domain S-box-containing protein